MKHSAKGKRKTVTDKERLDWLVKNKADLDCWNGAYWKTYLYGRGFGPKSRNPRAAIDAAILANKNK